MTEESIKFKKIVMSLTNIFEDMFRECSEHDLIKIPPLFVTLGKSYIGAIESDEMIHRFIDSSNQHWEKVILKDEEAINDTAKDIFEMLAPKSGSGSFFGGIVEFKLEQLENIFTGEYSENGSVRKVWDQERKDMVWKGVCNLIHNSVIHIFKKRKYDSVQKKYTVEFFENISLKKYKDLLKENFHNKI